MFWGGGEFGNNRKFTEALKLIVKGNVIFEYDKQLAPRETPYVAKNVQSQTLVPQQWKRSDVSEKLKGKWIVLYGLDTSIP